MLHVSAPWSHHQASTVEQIQISFYTVGIPRVYSAQVYSIYFSTVSSWDPSCTKSNLDLIYGRGLMMAPRS